MPNNNENVLSFKRKNDETESEYIYRICSNKDSVGSWIDVANLLNSELGYDYTECKYRKDFNSFQKMFEGNRERFIDNKKYLDEIKKATEELKKERYKLQTEKIEYNSWLRENARDELIVEKIIDSVSKINKLEIPEHKFRSNYINKEYVLAFGDEHYGSEFKIFGPRGDIVNEYSPEIFEQRMWKLLDKTIEIIEKENIGVLNVFCLGDFTDGILRIGQLVKLRYGVVDSTVNYMEFISNWLNELTRFVHVKFYMVDGNHSELRMFNQPRGSFKNENMGKIVAAYIKARLKDNKSFEFIENNSNMIYCEICGYNILGTHGEEKDMSKSIKDISNMYNENIDFLISGHLHHESYESVGIHKGVIRVPSIVGSDEFSIRINKASNPGALLIEFQENHGKSLEYNIDLS